MDDGFRKSADGIESAIVGIDKMATIRVHAPLDFSYALRSFITRILWEIDLLFEAFAEAQKMARASDERFPFAES